ncbi:hypothetical protein AS188_11870 [Kocuria flava]|uniref:4-hydroxybenzoate polyprenyltransferase n=1 Tax=Kocuria flava TaxID=446860 RepID=A0A0U2WVF2_9MICC|nr:hypothetical protein [Kocuria flava]ALU40340.1 hypothetical protein AS188_11870 [Kocuria flava]GEO90992.1 hypothetical protein KFL01_02980 [Kocuria flava]
MLQQIATTVLAATEEAGHGAAEAGIPPEVWGLGTFALLLTLFVVTLSYSNRSLSPEAGQHADPAALPAEEQAMLDEYHAKRHA